MTNNIEDILGKPKEGIHKYRLIGIAIMDFIFTIIIAIILSCLIKYIFKIKYKLLNLFLVTLFILLILGIILHRLFCVRTTIDKIIFPE